MTTQELKLNKLKELIQLADSGLTREEFTSNFKIIIDLIKSLKLANQQERESLLIMLKSATAKMASDQTDDMAVIKSEALAFLAKEMRTLMAEHKSRITELDNKMAEIGSIKPPDEALLAKTASDLAVSELLPKIPTNEIFKDNLSKAGDLIATSLENLDDDKKLEISAIKDLQKELDELRAMKGRTFGGGGLSKSALELHFVDAETPAEVPNGVITDFTTVYIPSPTASLKVFADGQRLKLTTDYTFSGKIVSFITAPLTDVLITFEYRI